MADDKTGSEKGKPKVRWYGTYKLLKGGYDPATKTVLDAIDASGLTDADISKISGVSKNTLSNWRNGNTRCPQFVTACATLRAAGRDFTTTKYESTTQKAQKAQKVVRVKVPRQIARRAPITAPQRGNFRFTAASR